MFPFRPLPTQASDRGSLQTRTLFNKTRVCSVQTFALRPNIYIALSVSAPPIMCNLWTNLLHYVLWSIRSHSLNASSREGEMHLRQSEASLDPHGATPRWDRFTLNVCSFQLLHPNAAQYATFMQILFFILCVRACKCSIMRTVEVHVPLKSQVWLLSALSCAVLVLKEHFWRRGVRMRSLFSIRPC